MWFGGVGELVPIEGNLNGEQYINILEASFLPSVRAYAIPEPLPKYMVQDNCPIHTCRLVKEWFTRYPEICLLDWPPTGCDMNTGKLMDNNFEGLSSRRKKPKMLLLEKAL